MANNESSVEQNSNNPELRAERVDIETAIRDGVSSAILQYLRDNPEAAERILRGRRSGDISEAAIDDVVAVAVDQSASGNELTNANTGNIKVKKAGKKSRINTNETRIKELTVVLSPSAAADRETPSQSSPDAVTIVGEQPQYEATMTPQSSPEPIDVEQPPAPENSETIDSPIIAELQAEVERLKNHIRELEAGIGGELPINGDANVSAEGEMDDPAGRTPRNPGLDGEEGDGRTPRDPGEIVENPKDPESKDGDGNKVDRGDVDIEWYGSEPDPQLAAERDRLLGKLQAMIPQLAELYARNRRLIVGHNRGLGKIDVGEIGRSNKELFEEAQQKYKELTEQYLRMGAAADLDGAQTGINQQMQELVDRLNAANQQALDEFIGDDPEHSEKTQEEVDAERERLKQEASAAIQDEWEKLQGGALLQGIGPELIEQYCNLDKTLEEATIDALDGKSGRKINCRKIVHSVINNKWLRRGLLAGGLVTIAATGIGIGVGVATGTMALSYGLTAGGFIGGAAKGGGLGFLMSRRDSQKDPVRGYAKRIEESGGLESLRLGDLLQEGGSVGNVAQYINNAMDEYSGNNRISKKSNVIGTTVGSVVGGAIGGFASGIHVENITQHTGTITKNMPYNIPGHTEPLPYNPDYPISPWDGSSLDAFGYTANSANDVLSHLFPNIADKFTNQYLIDIANQLGLNWTPGTTLAYPGALSDAANNNLSQIANWVANTWGTVIPDTIGHVTRTFPYAWTERALNGPLTALAQNLPLIATVLKRPLDRISGLSRGRRNAAPAAPQNPNQGSPNNPNDAQRTPAQPVPGSRSGSSGGGRSGSAEPTGQGRRPTNTPGLEGQPHNPPVPTETSSTPTESSGSNEPSPEDIAAGQKAINDHFDEIKAQVWDTAGADPEAVAAQTADRLNGSLSEAQRNNPDIRSRINDLRAAVSTEKLLDNLRQSTDPAQQDIYNRAVREGLVKQPFDDTVGRVELSDNAWRNIQATANAIRALERASTGSTSGAPTTAPEPTPATTPETSTSDATPEPTVETTEPTPASPTQAEASDIARGVMDNLRNAAR